MASMPPRVIHASDRKAALAVLERPADSGSAVVGSIRVRIGITASAGSPA